MQLESRFGGAPQGRIHLRTPNSGGGGILEILVCTWTPTLCQRIAQNSKPGLKGEITVFSASWIFMFICRVLVLFVGGSGAERH